MYLAARKWGIQPSEFWDMTMVEWMLEARFHMDQSPVGRAAQKRDEWLEDMEMTDEEWWAKHGTSQS